MSNNLFTIKEVADKLKVSRQSVYNTISKYKEFYQPYIHDVKGQTKIDDKGIELLKEKAHKQKKNKIPKKDIQAGNIDQQQEQLKEQIEELKKDKQYLQEQLDIAQANLQREQNLHFETKQELKLLQSGTTPKQSDIKDKQEDVKEDKQANKKGILSRLKSIFTAN